MKAKKLIEKIYKQNYTIKYESENIPLSDFDEGYKLACNVIIGIIYALNFTWIKSLYFKVWQWYNKMTGEI